MARRSGRVAWLLSVLFLCRATAADVATVNPKVAALRKLRDAAPSRIVTLGAEEWDRLAAAKDRPYTLLVFAAADSLMDSPKTKLGKLHKEYALAAQAYARGPDADSVFFCDIWYERSGSLFQRLQVASVPFVFLWSGKAKGGGGDSIPLPDDVKLNGGFSAYPWPAEEIVQWVEKKTGTKASPVVRPDWRKSPLFPLAILTALGAAAGVAWLLLASGVLLRPGLWAAGSLLVVWFSVSGGMYNIIRSTPMVMTGQDGKVTWWLPGRSGQLGAEGFVMGTSYVFFSLCLCLLIYGAPKVSSAPGRWLVSATALCAAALTARQVQHLWQHKTAFGERNFFFY